MKKKPWDAVIAARALTPIAHLPFVQPNLFTSARLATGLVGAWLFSIGSYNTLAALFFAVSNFLDHFDGELARMTNKSSKFGHYFDLISDLIVTSSTFLCIGVGISAHNESSWATVMGAIAGISVVVIFQLRHLIESSKGKDATIQPGFLGFEAEDILYLLPLVTLFDQLENFLILAAFGAPIASIIVLVQFSKVYKK